MVVEVKALFAVIRMWRKLNKYKTRKIKGTINKGKHP